MASEGGGAMADFESDYSRLAIGMTQREVTDLLGPPSTSKLAYRKEDPTTSHGSTLEYRFGDRSSIPNVNDVIVTLVFDESDRLVWAYPQNMPSLHEIGSRGRPLGRDRSTLR